MIVPRAHGWMRVAAGDNAKFGKWRRADESLVRINIVDGRMIDGQQANLIEVNGFFHRLHEAEAEQAIARTHAARVDLQIFVGIGNIAFSRRDPVPDYAGTNHVGDEFVLVTVPCKQNRAGTAAPIEFGDAVLFVRSEIDFVLGHAGGPEQANNFDVPLSAEARENRGRILPEVSGGALHFPLLIQRASVDFDFRANRALIVVQRFQIDANPIVMTAALIAQQDWRCAELRDN